MTTVREAHPFKLLAMVVLPNHLGELLGVKLTPGNVDDRKPFLSLASGMRTRAISPSG